MLGSVFNRYQASTSSEPSKAPQTKLRSLQIGKDTYPFSEFRGLGPPGLNIGLPGDIYIDVTPGQHALHARYSESWMSWPGPKDISTLLRHPMRSDRCLWCNDSIGWFHARSIRVNPSGTTSEVLSQALKYQATLLEESKKRKRDALGQVHQPIRTKQSPMTNISSSSRNRASLENQSWSDAPSFLHSTTSTPSLEIMIPGDLSPTNAPTIQNSGCCTESPTTDSYQSSIPTDRDEIFPSKDLKERSERNQERYTSPKRIDLRKIALGGAKLRLFGKLQKQRAASSPTHGLDAKSVLSSTYQAQSLPQLSLRSPPDVKSQPSIQDSETSRIFRNDDSLDQSIKTAMSGEPFVDNTDLQISPFSFNLSDVTGERFIAKPLHDSTSLASTDWDLPAHRETDLAKDSPLIQATQGNHIDHRPTLNIAIAELRKMKETSDANASYILAANDKIRLLEAENAKLRARLLNQCQCNLLSCDLPPTQVTDAEMPPVTDSDALNGDLNVYGENKKQPQNVEGLAHSQRESPGPWEIARNIQPSGSQLHPSYTEEIESTSALRRSPTPSTNFLADNSVLIEASVHVVPLSGSATVKYQNKVEADTLSIDESMNTCLSVREEIVDPKPWDASPVPMSSLLRMREIHRSVLFAKAGSLLICRLCLGTKSGGIETVDQAFKTLEGSPELMQEHCEKEHPNDCEALINMRDEELLDLVTMISSEC